MSFWSRLLGRREAKSITSSLDLWREVYGSRTVRSGVTVNWSTALDVATVLACCKVIAEGCAQVPWRLHQDTEDGQKRVAKERPLHNVIFRRPNRWQTSFEFRETILFHLILTGNAFVFIGRVGAAREVRELIPVEPGRVTVVQNPDLSLTYKIRGNDGREETFGQDAIWHLRGPSWNSWQGLEAVRLAREAIGLAIATEQAHAELHKNGARMSGLISIEGALSQERYELLTAWINKHVLGAENSSKPLILDNAAKYAPMTMTGVDAQHIETRKHQIEEICRALRVMPIMVGQSDKTATYASAEQMFIAHVVHTLSPWYERLQQSADVNLLSEPERDDGYYTKFDPNALMRGAAKDQAEYFAKALGSGGAPAWMAPNEVRAKIELPPLPGGDELPKPTNPAQPKTPPKDDGGEEDE